MSLCSLAMGNMKMATCLCTGACMQIGGSCSAYPNGRYNQNERFDNGVNISLSDSLLKRLEKLEQEKLIYKQDTIDNIHKRLNKIESYISNFILEVDTKMIGFIERINRLDVKIKESEENLIKPKHNKEENIFDFRQVDHKGRDDIRHIKNVLYDFYCWILDNVPDNKDRCEAISLLETAAMKLNKSISRRKDNERS